MKNCYGERTDLLLYKNHCCLFTILQNFCGSNGNCKHICRRCLNTHGDKIKLDAHLLRCTEQEV